MIRVVIIEDEKPAARRLNRMLDTLGLPVTAMLHSVNESVEYLLNNQEPDLIFLDIQLSDGLSFEIFDQAQVNSAIIFTTAYDEYALQAFKLNSVDYLLKPIDQDELYKAVEKFRGRFRESEQSQQPPASLAAIDYSSILKMLGSTQDLKYKKRFTTKVGEHIKLFTVDDISLFYSENKGCYLHLKSGRSYLLDTNLEDLEKELDPDMFHRISRQAIVNVHAIHDMVSYVNSRIVVKIENFTNFDLIVSRERVKGFRAWLEK